MLVAVFIRWFSGFQETIPQEFLKMLFACSVYSFGTIFLFVVRAKSYKVCHVQCDSLEQVY